MTLGEMLRTQFAFLAFRPVRISLQQDFGRWLAFVLVVTWIAGVGRYWDHPSAEYWQHLGLGSVVYIFCLSLLLYLVVWPLRPPNWTYRGVLVFVGLTSMPALLYAIPIERFVELKAAQSINAWFLGLVALWRVALLMRYLIASARLHWFVAATVSVLLLSGIVVTLTLLNLEHVVFDLMAGIREEDASPNDAAYLVVLGLAFLSLYAFPIALILYLGAVIRRRPVRRTELQ
ncbi:MAG: hypothetical protein QNJ07_09350 [Woeseiaceae bacterium]|nr:hypothetical protein [Woeseiaceae bacterium]